MCNSLFTLRCFLYCPLPYYRRVCSDPELIYCILRVFINCNRIVHYFCCITPPSIMLRSKTKLQAWWSYHAEDMTARKCNNRVFVYIPEGQHSKRVPVNLSYEYSVTDDWQQWLQSSTLTSKLHSRRNERYSDIMNDNHSSCRKKFPNMF